MTTRHKVLLVDDDPDLLEMYRGLLSQLPSSPDVQTAVSGARALAMLEDEPYRLLICDLRMPKMDGLQVLSIVRRKYPQLRTVAMTSVADEQFRSRVYALGVDLFWHKPSTEQEIHMFAECLESLLGQDTENGFRGVQSKSLVDIIQLECMSQSSAVLRITNGTINGRIWIQDGEVVDAETGDLRGETAFHKIFSWRGGTFETLPADPTRPRTISKSYNGLLLESAQVMDEAQSAASAQAATPVAPSLTRLAQVEGLEFVIAMRNGDEQKPLARGLEDPERIGNWARQNLERFRKLGDSLQAGPMAGVEGRGPQRQVVLARHEDTEFCVGWTNAMDPGQIRDLMKKVFALWA